MIVIPTRVGWYMLRPSSISGGATMMVRCIDNLLQSDILTEGHLYEVLAERDDCYVLSGFDKPLSKVRFEPGDAATTCVGPPTPTTRSE